MTATLLPWKVPEPVKKWKFMDDRSLSSRGPTASADIEAAIAATTAYDSSIGFVENKGKRQLWQRGVKTEVEHLGIICIPWDPTTPIRPRGGWKKLEMAIKVLGGLPGFMAVRERLAAVYVRPLWNWACPLLEPVPQKLVSNLYRAILSSNCDWWCQGRWWCQRVQLHPHFSAVLQTIKAVAHPNLVWSKFLEASVSALFKTIGFTYVAFEREWGIRVSISPTDDVRVFKATQKVRGADPHSFWTGNAAAEHALRIIARIRCLQSVKGTRNDSEGIDRVDLEASSHKRWTEWLKNLSAEQTKALDIFRSGAIQTPTRLRSGAQCQWCGFAWPSARHYWQDCPHFATLRLAARRTYKLPPCFFLRQPRVTSKSGWITYAAGRTVERRAILQIAACEVGLAIVSAAFVPGS